MIWNSLPNIVALRYFSGDEKGGHASRFLGAIPVCLEVCAAILPSTFLEGFWPLYQHSSPMETRQSCKQRELHYYYYKWNGIFLYRRVGQHGYDEYLV